MTHEDTAPLPIGAAIRQRRQRLRMTSRNLSATSGLSMPFVSPVARDQAMPSLVSLAQIAAAPGVQTGYFIRTPAQGQFVRRATAPEHLYVGAGPVDYVRLSGDHAGRRMESLRMTVPPGHASPISRFCYVLEGTLDVWGGREHFTPAAGDGAHFQQRHPYRMRNHGTPPVRVPWAGTPALL